jgi:hypothetical protein
MTAHQFWHNQQTNTDLPRNVQTVQMLLMMMMMMIRESSFINENSQ